jgi:hypothetical protein
MAMKYAFRHKRGDIFSSKKWDNMSVEKSKVYADF